MTKLSKSRFLEGRQCHRRLWLSAHGQSKEPTVESEDLWELRRLEGDKVERIVEAHYPNGIDISPNTRGVIMDEIPTGTAELIEQTEAALEVRQPIFQAFLASDDLLAIADILEPVNGGWFAWEVKASTRVKAIHDHDLAFQVEAARRAGVEIVGAGVWLLNKSYRRVGEVDTEEIVKKVDRTNEVFALSQETKRQIDEQLEILTNENVPDAIPGPRCKASRDVKAGDRPSHCGHLTAQGFCGSALPENWIGHLPRIAQARVEKLNGVKKLSIDQLEVGDDSMKWSVSQRRAIQADKDGAPFIDADALRAELDKLIWPLAYVDFEFDPSIGVPRFDNSSPYEKIPFQWSLHIQQKPGGELEAPEPFLWLERSDPRQAFADSLLEAIPREGSIVVHHKDAEVGVLNQVASTLGGNYIERIESLLPRIFDTEVLLRSGYYHPGQSGSYSIKKVALPLTGRSYTDLAIQDGMAAVVDWRKAIEDGTTNSCREAIRQQLLRYCGRDTELMHEIIVAIRDLL